VQSKPLLLQVLAHFGGIDGGVLSLTSMTGSPLRTVHRTPTMESALRNASSTNSSTVLPCAAVASVARWYNSSSTVNIDTQGTSLFSKPRRLTGVPPSRQTNVKRLPSLVDCPFATHSGSVHSSCPGQLQVSASALVAMQAGTRVAGEYSVVRTCEHARPIGSAPTTLCHAAMSLC
jgi:hypothetical protein